MVRVNGARRLIVVTGTGRAVYLLTGDTIQHPKCATSECHHVWMPVTAAHPVTRGLRAKVGIWHHSGLDQLTLNGHPLYEFVGDARPGEATGEGIHSFGGVWWVLCPKGNAVTGMAMGHTSSTMTAGSSGSASGTTPAGSAGGYGYGY
jgi:predicted lipoprotein with Yx(FWY)xxD motif